MHFFMKSNFPKAKKKVRIVLVFICDSLTPGLKKTAVFSCLLLDPFCGGRQLWLMYVKKFQGYTDDVGAKGEVF